MHVLLRTSRPGSVILFSCVQRWTQENNIIGLPALDTGKQCNLLRTSRPGSVALLLAMISADERSGRCRFRDTGKQYNRTSSAGHRKAI
eukprot:SAG31_NODE_1355_length_8661_cov_3.130343_4_plen_89_part_00